MIVENMSREQLVKFVEEHTTLCIKDLKLRKAEFAKGERYKIYQDEGGTQVIDNNGTWLDIYDVKDIEKYFICR